MVFSMSEHSGKGFIKPAGGRLHIDPNVVIQAAMLSVCVMVLYWPVIPGLIKSWDPDNYPGFVVPLASIYLVWHKRSDLRKAKRSPEIWGLLIVFIGGVWLLLGKVGALLFIGHISFVVTLIGLIIYILGWEYFKLLSFPLLFLFLMIRVPSIFYRFVLHKLQFVSAYFGSLCLHVVNVPVVREGDFIHLPKISMVVAEACAGMRYVFATTILAVFLIYLTQRTWAARILFMIAAILIAVTANVLRVATAGAMAYFIGVKMISGFYHKLHGVVMFLFSYGGLIGTAFLFSRIFRKKARL
jgi:exosortase